FKDKATAMDAPLYFAGKAFEIEKAASDENSNRYNVYFNKEIYLSNLSLSLTGDYQVLNVGGILKSIQILDESGFTIPEKAIRDGFLNVKTLTGLKGRWQILGKNPLIVCDTGHNEAGVNYIVNQLRSLRYNHLYIVLGVSNDKKLDGIFRLLPEEAFYYFCQAKLPRALQADLLATSASRFGLKGRIVPDVNEAIKEAKSKALADDLVFIGGS